VTSVTLSSEDRAAADRFISAARVMFGDRLLRAVLYGSKARGDAHAESDLDLLLVLRGDGAVDWQDARAASFLAADVGLETGVDVSVKCMSAGRFERERLEPTGFASRVGREGVTLWRDQREYGDYEVASIIGPELARRTVADAQAFIEAVEALLRAEGHVS
jgi:predicted nucleotidyltransferase